MARLKGSRKLKSLEDQISENETKIQDAEELLKSLKEEKKALIEKKEQTDLKELLQIMKDSGISVAKARDILLRNEQE
ncbi:hypothetical protein [Anaerotignum sp.]|uniref:hypothetical protein n=1 Tax=Anaerotignum sp. TaxID=2039241 RepID=UPI0028A925B7|nr:hypothetical protein [Anaerotignum sp.]